MEETIKELAENFAVSLNFASIDAMKETAQTLKQMHLEQNCPECSAPKNLLKSFNKSLSDNDNVLSSSGENIGHVGRKSFRKSRKSVCVLPKFISSSESENESEESCDEDNEINEINNEEGPNESPLYVKHRNRTQVILSDNEDEKADETDSEKTDVESDSDNNLKNGSSSTRKSGNESLLAVGRKKKLQRIVSDDEEENLVQVKNRTINRVSESSDDGNSMSCVPNNLHDCTKKKITYDSDEDNSFNQTAVLNNLISKNTCKSERNSKQSNVVSLVSSDEDQLDDYIGTLKKGFAELDVESTSSDDMSEFIVDDVFDEATFKTPKPMLAAKKVLSSSKFNSLVTPKSAARTMINRLHTPKSVPGTPAYKREFNKIKDGAVKDLFKLFNHTVFGDKLPSDFRITWNNRMTKTAGFCYYSHLANDRTSRIELSDKVIDCVERIRDTLIHELCHAATWIIDGKKAGHGPAWKYWAKRANKIHPDIPVISRCHQYEIHTKYNYQCNGCGQIFGRHSKSINSSHVCARCGGIPELIQNNKQTPKTPNSYALFVKENFASVKKANPGFSHKQLMENISQKFKIFKLQNKENEACSV
ncbi:germ cell nuclear acidic protein-like [Hydractinia symbiolongicarpus]|uniref:germ cell nuclear acidic protein-like n=1 Tax=Hydractinia symbiolongicarpus TaxID=13093 RepID=UPI00254B10CA|nr:germ cell nuclear acidic protein-like [Hydractinia symbiolongicarpus]